jgi:hypothetical protein
LLERGYAVVLINPYQAAQFRRSQGAKAKTDRIDARALARFVAVSGLRALSATDARLVGLREVTRFRADLVGQRTTALNALQGALDLAFPELLTVFKQPGSRSVLSLLEAFPTAAAMASASEEELAGCLRQVGAGRPRHGQLAALLEAARRSVAAKRLDVALSVKIRVLVRQIQVFDREIAELGHAPRPPLVVASSQSSTSTSSASLIYARPTFCRPTGRRGLVLLMVEGRTLGGWRVADRARMAGSCSSTSGSSSLADADALAATDTAQRCCRGPPARHHDTCTAATFTLGAAEPSGQGRARLNPVD